MQIVRPTRVLWKFPTDAVRTWPSLIPSKSIRKLASQLHETLAENSLIVSSETLGAESYANWWEFYRDVMTELGHDLIAKPEWFTERHTKNKSMWLITFFQHSQRVGASIITESPDGTHSHAFKVSTRIDLKDQPNASLGTLMELYFLSFAHEHQAPKITSGRSRNAFGFYNTVGYLTSKLKMGYMPVSSQIDPLSNDLPQTSPDTPTIWLCQIDGIDTLVLSAEIGAFDSELKTYIDRLSIPFILLTELKAR